MKNLTLRQYLVIFFSGVSLWQSFASANAFENVNWKSVQAGVIGINQDKGFSGSALLRYDPKYQISEKWSVGASADASYQMLDSDTKFFAISYLANLKYNLNSEWSAQLSAGAQTWTCDQCKTKAAYGVLASYAINPTWSSLVKDVWVQYLTVSQEPRADQALLGLSLQF